MTTSNSELCPECGAKGRAVKAVTVDSFLTASAKSRLSSSDGFRLCLDGSCAVSYYGSEVLNTEDVRVPIFQKSEDPARPVCYCFDHSVGEVQRDVLENGRSTITDSIRENCEKGLDACAQNNPQGSCCLGNVARVTKAATAEVGEIVADDGSDCCGVVGSSAARPDEGGRQLGVYAAVGAVATAVLSSTCCWLPLALIAAGASAVGVSAFFEQYRSYLLVTTGLLLAGGFYLVYGRKEKCGEGEACAVPSSRIGRLSKISLWVAVIFVGAFALFPNYAFRIIGAEAEDRPEVIEGLNQIAINIEGMSCQSCAVSAGAKLAEVGGVHSVSVDFETKRGTIVADDSVSVEALEKAVESAGFVGTIVGEGAK